MREHVQMASRRRDERLARIRKITLWIGGSAAAASLGLGTAFADAVPGHASAATSTPGSSATSTAPASSGSASSGSAKPAPARSSASQPTQLQPPQQQPAQTAAPHKVTSGGS